MDGYLTKPIRREVLRKEIDRPVTTEWIGETVLRHRRIARFSGSRMECPRVADGSRETRTSSAELLRCRADSQRH